MRRTNIYLDERQLDVLKQIGESRNQPVSGLIREAVDAWLDSQGVKVIGADEWQRRFDSLMKRRVGRAAELSFSEEEAISDVEEAVRRVRGKLAARRR